MVVLFKLKSFSLILPYTPNSALSTNVKQIIKGFFGFNASNYALTFSDLPIKRSINFCYFVENKW